MKVKIHPLFLALVGYFAITGKLLLLCGYFVAILLHEIAHARMAGLRGYAMGTVKVMPYGGVIEGGGNYNKTDNVLIALAGPLANFVLAAFLAALWWLLPESYVYTEDFCTANLCLGIVNLLPVYPLDGSRIVYALAANKLRAIKAMKIGGCAAGAALIALCVASVFYQFNLSLGIFGFFLAAESFSGSEENSYLHVTEHSPLNKRFDEGLRVAQYVLGEGCPLYRALALVNAREIATFLVVDGAGRELGRFDEKRLGALCTAHELKTPVGALIAEIADDGGKSLSAP